MKFRSLDHYRFDTAEKIRSFSRRNTGELVGKRPDFEECKAIEKLLVILTADER